MESAAAESDAEIQDFVIMRGRVERNHAAHTMAEEYDAGGVRAQTFRVCCIAALCAPEHALDVNYLRM